MKTAEQLLIEYAETGSETAFREVVESYVNLVYSAALRLVNGDSHLAEDVTQAVFADLARAAGKLSPKVMLGGWLHRHTCFIASKTVRGERRRQLRERQAAEMNSIEDHSEANLALIAPILDEAINELGSEDRAAILLRYFEQKDFQSVGDTLGSNEEAARKRVNRALDKLHSSLTRRGVVLSATGLAAALSAQAITAAPAGMALSISTAALAAVAATGGTGLTFLQLMSTTKLQIGIVTAVVAAIAIPLAMEYQSNKALRQQNASLRLQSDQLSQLSAENKNLSAENKRLSNVVAQAHSSSADAMSNEQLRELMKLRGEVGRLKTDANAPKPSAISGILSDPATAKMMRDQQKMGMEMIYKKFTGEAKFTPEQKTNFVNLLADDIMENVGQVSDALSQKKSREEIGQIFTEREAALQQKVQDLLGPDGFSKYQDYTRDLASHLTAEQFAPQLTCDKAEKDQKSKQLFEAMRDETQTALADAGLPADFQTVPILNFRNIASEDEADKNLKLLQDIYQRVATRAGAFLSTDELKNFSDFQTLAIQQNRMGLALNRKMMAPSPK
jgi:RNA polymerase sigma factor (sigma-70 family)